MKGRSSSDSRSLALQMTASEVATRNLNCLLSALVLLAGCGGDSTSNQFPQEPNPTSIKLAGKLLGGQQPLKGSSVQLFASGSGGYGTGAEALTSPVFTDQNGSFSITGDYTCQIGRASCRERV